MDLFAMSERAEFRALFENSVDAFKSKPSSGQDTPARPTKLAPARSFGRVDLARDPSAHRWRTSRCVMLDLRRLPVALLKLGEHALAQRLRGGGGSGQTVRRGRRRRTPRRHDAALTQPAAPRRFAAQAARLLQLLDHAVDELRQRLDERRRLRFGFADRRPRSSSLNPAAISRPDSSTSTAAISSARCASAAAASAVTAFGFGRFQPVATASRKACSSSTAACRALTPCSRALLAASPQVATVRSCRSRCSAGTRFASSDGSGEVHSAGSGSSRSEDRIRKGRGGVSVPSATVPRITFMAPRLRRPAGATGGLTRQTAPDRDHGPERESGPAVGAALPIAVEARFLATRHLPVRKTSTAMDIPTRPRTVPEDGNV